MPMANGANKTAVVNVGKSVGVSLLLTFLFGPLGMFYSTVVGGIVMLILCIVVFFFTMGFGLIVLWPICMIWGAVAVGRRNQELARTL
ncbi:MAG: hypothetical protein WB626_11865 [Bacteroidota bacterium]